MVANRLAALLHGPGCHCLFWRLLVLFDRGQRQPFRPTARTARTELSHDAHSSPRRKIPPRSLAPVRRDLVVSQGVSRRVVYAVDNWSRGHLQNPCTVRVWLAHHEPCCRLSHCLSDVSTVQRLFRFRFTSRSQYECPSSSRLGWWEPSFANA